MGSWSKDFYEEFWDLLDLMETHGYELESLQAFLNYQDAGTTLSMPGDIEFYEGYLFYAAFEHKTDGTFIEFHFEFGADYIEVYKSIDDSVCIEPNPKLTLCDNLRVIINGLWTEVWSQWKTDSESD